MGANKGCHVLDGLGQPVIFDRDQDEVCGFVGWGFGVGQVEVVSLVVDDQAVLLVAALAVTSGEDAQTMRVVVCYLFGVGAANGAGAADQDVLDGVDRY